MRFRFRDTPGIGIMTRINTADEDPIEKRFKAIEDCLKGIRDRLDAMGRTEDEDPDEDSYDGVITPAEDDESDILARQGIVYPEKRTGDEATVRRMEMLLADSARRWGRTKPTCDSGSKMDRFLSASKARWARRKS